MGHLAIPIAIGAAIGGGTKLVQGKGLGDILKGAVIGGGVGGLTGGVGAGASSGLAANGTGIAINDLAASPFLPTALQGSTLATGIGSGATGTGITLAQGAGDLFNPVAQGAGMGSINNLAQYSTGTGYDLLARQPTMFDKLKPYLNVKDLSGAAQVASQFQPEPLPTPQSGNVTRGQAPQGNDVMSLLQSIKLPERRRLTLL